MEKDWRLQTEENEAEASYLQYREEHYYKFAVEFLDPDYDIDADDADDEFHGYRAEIAVDITGGQFDDNLHQTAAFDEIESKYGILDVNGDTTTMGFCSYEISMEDASSVFDQLCDLIRDYIKGEKSEEFVGLD